MTARKARYSTRDPKPEHRDPKPEQRKPRHYIPASMPVVCPKCGGPTRMADGRHTDEPRQMILEYRTCARCGYKMTAGRTMVPHEVAKFCRGFEEGIREYQESVRVEYPG